ncbi:MAG: MBL fold metallo-hydrolase, partial [Rhizobiales bacterium]|nr:MBL fold metallo-hydrolase [Hyphomicrobiales bacterium]
MVALGHAAGPPAASASPLIRAQAADPGPEMTENCPGLVARGPRGFAAPVVPVALGSDQVRLTFVGHATFLIESPKGVRIATDYNDYVKPPVLPDIVTMNHAHSSHYTDFPDPAIRHVLRGWDDGERPARHDVHFGDVRVRNVPTN